MTPDDEHGPAAGGATGRDDATATATAAASLGEPSGAHRPAEVGGPGGPEPTRYGDWERAGRCIDF